MRDPAPATNLEAAASDALGVEGELLEPADELVELQVIARELERTNNDDDRHRHGTADSVVLPFHVSLVCRQEGIPHFGAS